MGETVYIKGPQFIKDLFTTLVSSRIEVSQVLKQNYHTKSI